MILEGMKLDRLGPSHWTGVQAGLKFPDTLLKANGQIITSRADLDELIAHTRVGDSIRYDIERAGQSIEVSVPTMIFTWLDLFMKFGVLFIMGWVLFLLGVVVFVLKPDAEVSWTFLSSGFFLAMDYIDIFDYEPDPYGFMRLIHLGMKFFPATILHLSSVFPEKWFLVKKYPYIILMPYLLSTFFEVSMDWLYLNQPLHDSINKLYTVYLALSAVGLLASIGWSYWKSTSVLTRARAKVVLLGAAFAFPIPALSPILSAYGNTLAGIPTAFTSIPLMFFPASIGYAIARHNLFDVDVYIKRAVGYVLMTVIVAMAYFSIQTLISEVVLTPMLGENAQKVYPILFALLVVFLFNPVNRIVQDAVDKMFFRKKFDYKEMVASVSNALTSLLNLDEIIRQVIHTVRKEMFIDTAGVVILDRKKKSSQTFFIGDESVRPNDGTANISIGYDDPLLALVSKEKKLVTKYDIAEDPHYAHLRESCGRRFSEMGASVAIPLIYRDEVTGMLALGHKKSGQFYTREDIDLLTTLANQGAVAIENAKMAEQMKKEETVRTNLARYLSPQIVDQIIQKDVKVNLGGDRKVVTVLFSDIRNFTTITETRPPDQLVQILNDYFTEMAGIIFENQGSLDKYIGDAIVAVFGSLIPLENSAAHAVTAAIEMMKRLPSLNEQWMKNYGFTINIGIGINTGEVFLGNIGSPERMEFTVIGDTVNVASRFSGLAKPGQILMTRETFACLGPDIKYKELPPSEVKGKTGKLEVFEVLSE